jgi:hypothetical protein
MRRAVLPVLALGLLVSILPEIARAERPALPGGIDDKPYLGRGGATLAIGGYMGHEFEWVEDGGNTFDQHRFVPFITSTLGDRIRVSSEIEFEHGGLVKGGGDSDGEIKLEYAVIDYRLRDALSFRAGLLLAPLGLFNLLHDSPLNDLTARPVVDRQLIPSTLSESGMGFFGGFYPGEESVASYELYLVNGFDEGIITTGETAEDAKLRIRGGRGSQKRDNNENKAIAGRLGFSPRLGIDLGLSGHGGSYDDAGELRLSILALDAKFSRGPIELQGEYVAVSADIDRALHPEAAESQRGGYAQAAYHFAPDAVEAGSIFTLVGRWDWVDYDSDLDGDSEEGLTLGLNYRPVEDTVFKLDYNRSWTTPAEGVRDEGSDRLFFSVATYF